MDDRQAPSASGTRRGALLLRGAVSGLVAAVVALGVAELVAAISSSFRSPVIDVGDKVVDLVPPFAKDLAIRWFGTGDKVALLVGIGVLLALYAALVGIVATGTRRHRGRPAVGVVGIALFGLVGAAAALTARDERSVVAVLPSLVGAAAGAGALALLVRAGHSAAARPPHGTGSPDGTTRGSTDVSRDPVPAGVGEGAPSRRAFLVVGATLGAAGVAAAATGRWLGARFSAAASRAALVLPEALRPLPAVPASVSVDVEGVTPFVTPNGDFYRIDTALQVPQVQIEDWRLRVGGMVERPMDLTFRQLSEREVIEADITLTCVSNEVGGGLLGSARWLGVRLDDLLEDAGVRRGADQVVGRSVDGYTCGFPVSALDGRDALVAFGMNGEPLPLEHGFPARLIVPGLYGYVSATKWLTGIELTTFDSFDQYWVPRGWDAEAPIKTSSRIDTPRGLARIPAGTTAVAGVAWAQTRGISAVEVRVDDGPWERAELAAELNDVTWRQWAHRWEATPGQHSLTVRAIDGTGAIQTAERSEPMPNGSSGLHQIVVLVD
jgi:DMSO/TMAO reductase YedYZ molybdopterin-dependent catalytic subunit